jgi:hypothetical protein
MANTLYFLGDMVSKPMSWGWMDSDSPPIVWIGSYNYNIYNWLMLKSVNFNDKSDCGIWGANEDDDSDEV